jgi:NMD protein affecting ribosome stability and mRNA decay
MKGGRAGGGSRPPRREQLLDDPRHDAYKSKGKLPDPTRCPECSAVFRKGRWTWDGAPGETVHEQLCPACQRIRDGFPAGYVSLIGEYLADHRDEILNLAKNCEAKEKAEHPLQRIIAIKDIEGGVMVTTTDAHLARRIAENIHDACKGSLALQYNKEENLLRATWTR